jgi:carbonic anhydrase/acetyltransferase-like protein (isoleucine patch superfamily)
MASFKRTPNGVYICDSCMITGDVKLGVDSSVWFSAVIRGDVAPVTIGNRTNVQDGAVVHCDTDVPNVIEDDVVIGHRAVVHGTHVGAGSLIGMGAVLLSRTRIGKGCLVAAGAVVPPDLVVPDGMVVMGVPGKIVRPVKPEELEYMKWLVPHYVELAQKYVDGKMGPTIVG